jgi:hypothetical protein
MASACSDPGFSGVKNTDGAEPTFHPMNNLTATEAIEASAAPAKPSLSTDPHAYIASLPKGMRGLFALTWFSRENSMCSTALRIRAFLCSLYNGSAGRKVDLSEIQGFDGELREAFAEVILCMGAGYGLYDYHIRDAYRCCGIERYFDAGFPRRRGGAK